MKHRKDPTISMGDSATVGTTHSLELRHSSNGTRVLLGGRKAIVSDKPWGGISRARAYLRYRSAKEDREDLLITTFVQEAENNEYEATPKVDTLFARFLNRCDPSNLPDLRLQRAEAAPIVCQEESGDEEGKEDNDQEENLELLLGSAILCGGRRYIVKSPRVTTALPPSKMFQQHGKSVDEDPPGAMRLPFMRHYFMHLKLDSSWSTAPQKKSTTIAQATKKDATPDVATTAAAKLEAE